MIEQTDQAATSNDDSEASNENESIAWPCSGFQAYLSLTGDSFLRDTLMTETGGGDAFIERASTLMRHFVLDTEPYQTQEGRYAFGQRLHRAGYSNDTIAYSLARAWLAQTDTFYLPRLRKRDHFKSRKTRILVSLAASLTLVIAFMLYIRHAHPKLAAALLGMEPILAAAGMLIAIPLFWALERFMGHEKKGS